MNDIKLSNMDSVEAYPFVSTEDMYAIKSPPMLIEGILPKQTITGLTSFPGTGKTWLAFEFMRSIATGGRFLERFDAEQGSVLFVGSDASVHDYARQWRNLSSAEWASYAPTEEQYAAGQVPYNPLQSSVKFLVQSDFLFEDLSSVRRLIKSCWDHTWGEPKMTDLGPMWRRGFSLIIFDTLSKLTRANQNDNTEMEEVFRNIRLISESTKAGVVLLHHNSYRGEYNDGESWRGASSQIAALDNWFQIGAEDNDKYHINLKVKRFRGITPEPFSYKMVLTEDSAKLAYTEAAQSTQFDDGILQSINNFLLLPTARGHWFSAQQIADGLWEEYKELFGNAKDRFLRAVRNRINEGVTNTFPTIQKRGGGRRSQRAYFSAVETTDVPRVDQTTETD